MIRIVIGPPAPTGFFPYKIEGHWGPDGCPLIGIAENPVAEASRVLQALGVPTGTQVEAIGPGEFRTVSTISQGILEPGWQPVKALPAPRRRPRKRALQVRGSGVPGDG